MTGRSLLVQRVIGGHDYSASDFNKHVQRAVFREVTALRMNESEVYRKGRK